MKFDKDFIESKLFNRGVTVVAIIFAIFAVWGGLGGLSQDAKVIKNELSDSGGPSHASIQKDVKVSTESKGMELRSEENSPSATPSTSTYTSPKPEAPVQSNPDRINGYQFRVSEKTGYHCLTAWLEKHKGLTNPGGELNIEHNGPHVLYGGSKGYYVYSIHGIRGYSYPLIVLVDDADGNLWYSQSSSLDKLGAYDRLDVWYRDFVTEKR